MNRLASKSSAPHAAAIDQFLKDLAEEAALLQQLVQIVTDLRAQIAKNQIESLEDRIAVHQKVVQQLAQRSTRRVQTLQEIAVRFDLKSDDITIRALSEAIGGELGKRLDAAADELQRHGREIARLNRQNAAMIVQSADLTREVIQVLTNSDPGGNSYDAGGGRQDAVGRSMVELDG